MQGHEHKSLGLRAWADLVGHTGVRAVMDAAGIHQKYFYAMANYTKSCTPACFERIEAAARRLTPGIVPDYETCTRKSVREAALAAKRAARAAAKAAPKVAEQKAAMKRAEMRKTALVAN